MLTEKVHMSEFKTICNNCHLNFFSKRCLCPRGWFGLHCRQRTVDCRGGSNAELCGHGTCVTQYNDVGYKCICDEVSFDNFFVARN